MHGCSKKQIESIEKRIWKRMERISWKDKVSKEKVLSRARDTRSWTRPVCKRKKLDIGLPNLVPGQLGLGLNPGPSAR